ncbi:MAG: MurR/RpiR family transcriptional regulator, partial [Lachnospiraceae bacterium]|nr:MurR/RpiR family transcriptional regulator [Lachnospiraceae bacterium]
AVDPEAFDHAVRGLLNAENIYIVGTRSSTALADYMYFYMTLILDRVHLVQFATGADLYEQLLRIGSKDALVGITFPRYSRRTVEAMRYAKKNGAMTIGITDSEVSPVVKLSDDVLYARNDVTSFVDSLVAPMALINALVSELGQRRKEETKANLAKLEGLWAENTVYDRGNNG